MEIVKLETEPEVVKMVLWNSATTSLVGIVILLYMQIAEY